jgi:hypothetical protein
MRWVLQWLSILIVSAASVSSHSQTIRVDVDLTLVTRLAIWLRCAGARPRKFGTNIFFQDATQVEQCVVCDVMPQTPP